jgi:hypothetical protein
MCKKCVERQTEKKKTGESGKRQAEKCLTPTQRSPLRPSSKIIFPTAISQPQIVFLPASPPLTRHGIGVPVSPASSCFQHRNLSTPAPGLRGPLKSCYRGVSAQNPLSPLPSLEQFYLPTCPIFNPTSAQPRLSDLPSVIMHFLAPSFVSKRLDLLKACNRTIIAFTSPPQRPFDSLSSILEKCPVTSPPFTPPPLSSFPLLCNKTPSSVGLLWDRNGSSFVSLLIINLCKITLAQPIGVVAR